MPMREHRPEVMDLLAKTAPNLDGAPDPEQRARDLARILAQPRSGRRTVPVRWWIISARRPLARSAAVAATLLAAAVAVTTLVPSEPGTRGVTPGPEGVLPARRVLFSAALAAEAQPATTGRWWHTERRHAAMVPFEAGDDYGAFSLVEEGAIANWSPARGTQAWAGGTKPYYHFPTPQDEVNWRRAGEPFKPGPSGGKRPGLVQRHRDPRALEQPLVPQHRVQGPRFWVLGRTSLTVGDVRRLPTTPAALQRKLLSMRVPEPHGDRDTDAKAQWLWSETPNLLAEWPLTPRTRAAAYRMLAGLPGIRSVGRVTDPLGRSGVAVARTEHDQGFGTAERQLVFDSDTSAFLASQTILRTPAASAPAASPGTRLDSYALAAAEWVDHLPAPSTHAVSP
jgi:hypothetical protein